MRVYDPSKPLFSLHIPKCGGSSLRDVLNKWYGRNFCIHYEDASGLSSKPVRKHDLTYLCVDSTYIWRRWFDHLNAPHIASIRLWRRGPTCLHGHFLREAGIGVYDYYPEAEQFILFLRDPVEVAISEYFWRKDLGMQPDFSQPKFAWIPRQTEDKGIDVNQFLRQRVSFMPKFLPADLTVHTFREFFNRTLVYIGIVEDFQTSVNILADRLGMPRMEVPRLNTSTRDEPIHEEARQCFVERHPFEYALYQYAVENHCP